MPMRTNAYRSRRTYRLCVMSLACCFVGAFSPAEEPSHATTTIGVTSPLPRGIVVQQHADVVGQVYIASERPGEEEEPARNVSVRVIIPESGDVLYETRADKNGAYFIPRLNPGAYRLHVGAFQISFFVESNAPISAQLPKVVITILPRDMVRRP